METMAEMYGDAREEADATPLSVEGEGVYSGEGVEKMMSMEQLKQEMFKSLRDTGTIEAIRAQLRRRFIEKLKQHGRKQAALDGSDNNDHDSREKWHVDDHLVHGLIHEYLQRHDMEHTLAVFVPEIGGAQQWLSRDAIVKMLRLPEESSTQENYVEAQPPLLAMLLKELQRRLAVATMSSATQTAMDCSDHRIALENQLRRVETTYLAESASHKQDLSVKTFEERVLRYQREYDELCENRLQDDLERFKTTELGLMRVDERKKFDREMESLKTTLFQEHRERLQRLHDRDRELEMMFSARKTELESSLFEARQRLFQEIETLRIKQHDVEARSNAELRQLAMEAKRLQLLEEKIKVKEENLEAAMNDVVGEKEKAWQLERLRWQSDARDREEKLVLREQEAEKGVAAAKQAKDEMQLLRLELTRLEEQLVSAQGLTAVAHKTIAKLEAEKKMLNDDLTAREDALSEDKHSMRSLSYENARLAAELKTLQNDKSRLEDLLVERSSDAKQLEVDVKDLQHQLINHKLAEANAVVEERKKLMQILENERSDARWKENDLVGKLLELQTRLAESEASREKYQTQYEDEKVHVETLRHEVSSLHTLLAQTQSAVATRQPLGSRALNARHVESSDSASERMLMKMMEMMTMQIQSGGSVSVGGGGPRTQWSAPQRVDDNASTKEASAIVPPRQDEEEAKKLQAEQERRERELLDQREYERKKQERDEAEKRELESRRKKFDDEMEQERLARAKREQELEDERRRRAAEQESRFQEELQQQQKAIQEARETQKKLLDDQIAQEQKRLQDERLREQERARATKEESDIAERKLLMIQEEQKEEGHRAQEAARLRREAEEAAAARERQLREHEQKDEAERGAAAKQREAAEERQMKPAAREEDAEIDIQDTPSVGESPLRSKAPSDEAPAVKSLAVAVQEQVIERDLLQVDDGSDSESYRSEHDKSISSESEEKEENKDTASEDANAVDGIDAAPIGDEERGHEVIPSSADTQEDSEDSVETPPIMPPPKTEEELEEERRQAAEEAKKKEDEASLDVFRQRVLARRAAEKQRQQELEEQKQREEEERAAADRARLEAEASEDEMEHSGGSFASSAASSSGSF